MLSALTLGLATNLTSDLLKAGSRRLRDRVQGEPQERALRRVYTAAFEALLDQIGDGLSEGEVETLARRAFQPFLNQAGVAAALLDVALIQREPDPAWLYAQFETARDADALHNIRFDEQTFERGMLEFQRTLTQEVLQDAAKPESSLFNLETVAALQELLRRTEALLAQPHPSAPAPQRATFPLHLGIPSTRPHFVGRDELMDELVARLSAGQATALSAEGLPGVGKTTLAVHLAHDRRIREHFVDGILWASLGPEGDPLRAMGPWLEALDLDPRTLPDLRARSRALRNGLAERKLLIVWDDLWDSPGEPVDVDALRCGGPGCAYLLTTRNTRLARDFAGAAGSVAVAVLSDEEAYALLHDLAPAACDADPDAAFALAALAGGLPLTVELLGGYLANAGDNELFADLSQAAMAELRDPRRRLDLARRRLEGVDGREETLRETIHFSLDSLRRAGRDEAVAAFHALSAFAPKPATFTRDAAEQVAECGGKTLHTLAQRNLLEQEEGELSLHQTLHDVAAEELPSEARTRHRDYYLDLVDRDRENVDVIGEIYPQIEWAWEQSPLKTKRLLVDALEIYQNRRGLWYERVSWVEYNMAVMNDSDDRLLADYLHELGSLYSVLWKKEKALICFEQALAIVRDLDDEKNALMLLTSINRVYSHLGRKREALTALQQILPLMRSVGEKGDVAVVLSEIGATYCDLGDKRQGLDHCKQALSIFKETRNQHGQMTALKGIGQAYGDLGYKQQALKNYEQALVLASAMGNRFAEAGITNDIGWVHLESGEERRALKLFQQALPIFQETGNPTSEARALNNIGLAYFRLEIYQFALTFYKQALSILQKIGDRNMEATTLSNIGSVYSSLNKQRVALGFLKQALLICQEVGDRWQESVTRYNIGVAYQAIGKLKAAEREFSRVVYLDKINNHPDLQKDQLMLAAVRVQLTQNKAEKKKRKKQHFR